MFSTAHGEPGKEPQCFQRWGWDGDEGSGHPIPMLPRSPVRGFQAHQRQCAPSCPGPAPRCHRAMLLTGGCSADEQSHLTGTGQGTSHRASLLPPQPFPCFKTQGSDSTANLHPSAHRSLRNVACPAKSTCGQTRCLERHSCHHRTESHCSTVCTTLARGWLQTPHETSLPLQREEGRILASASSRHQ